MRIPPALAVALLLLPYTARAADDLQPLLKTLQSVGPNAQGHREAAVAWQRLAAADAGQLPVILGALDGAGPLAANWLRTAIDAIAERQLQRGGELPAAELEAFVRDTRHSPRGRRLAYEWLAKADADAPARLLPGMLDDPGPEMRRDAVARVIGEAEVLAKAEKRDPALAAYQKALSAATDLDQVRLLAERLRKLGREVDVRRQLGLIVRWRLIGPFDNMGEKGYDAVYPPEQEGERQAECLGKHGTVRWIDHTTTDELGLVDLNRALGTEKGVAAYAAGEFLADQQREVEFRMTSFNAVKLWLNGKLIDQHKVYHSGAEWDQYVSRGTLRPGRNVLLVKICQNEQKQDWAVHWAFRLRVCDLQGKPVLSTDRR
jgi:tetratricopeptide (TPR) repeat protein